MDKALFALAALFALLAATTVTVPLSVLQWKLSVLATEYGHLFSPAAAVVGIALGARGGRRSWFGAAAALGAAAFFLQPYATARQLAPAWRVELEEHFGPAGPLVTFGGLWRGEGPGVAVKTLEVKGLQVALYPAVSDGPAPWVVVVHGGGWDSGDNGQLPALNHHLARRGIAVAAVSYRLVPGHRWPAQRDDVLAIAGHLKDHAAALNLDPARWALLGRSAGGHIAQAAAYASKDPALKGVVAFYAPADLLFAYENAEEDDIIHSRQLVVALLGGKPAEAPAAYKDGSPIEFVSKNAPPTLLLHGTRDLLTWVVQSRRLRDRLKAAGAQTVLLELPWAVHGFDYNFSGPGGQVSRGAVDVFLDAVLKK